jgi:hypothetical protein
MARPGRAAVILYAFAALALAVAVAAGLTAVSQARSAASQARAAAARAHRGEVALKAEVRAHCVSDARVSNRQRKLDLGLIASDQTYLAILRREAEHPASAHDETLIGGEAAWLHEVLHVRLGDLPPYRDPSRC